MGQYAKIDNGFNINRDILLDEDFDQLSQQEEWSNSASNVIEFKAIKYDNSQEMTY